MGFVEVVGLAFGAVGCGGVVALVAEARRGRKAAEAMLAELEGQRAHREEVFERAVRILHAALDEGQARAVVFDPPEANDNAGGGREGEEDPP